MAWFPLPSRITPEGGAIGLHLIVQQKVSVL